MAITLEADNRALIQSNKYSYLTRNYSSGITSFVVLNATDSVFATDAFLLIGNFGAENAEIMKISTVNNSTGEIKLSSTTKFAHPESTKVTVLPYNQIRFFHTTTTTFATSSPLTGYVDIQPSDWFTTYIDETNSSGYGWYTFYNSVTAILSQESNSIPYIGFESNTTDNILEDFFSMLNNKELKLVTREDALSWASEGYGRMRNKLNLTNVEYSASNVGSFAIISGTIEYDLPADFDHLVAILSGLDQTNPGAAGGNKLDIEFIPLTQAYAYNGSKARYYIRGSKIGFLPTPTTSTTYNYIYLKSAARLDLNTDEVDLPNGGEYVIKDWMLYRAYKKFQNTQQSKDSFEAFNDGLDDMVISAVKRDANLDTWGIAQNANV